MSNIATYLETILLNLVMRNTAYPDGAPAAVYCGLVETGDYDAELEAGTLTHEITTYTGNRKAITFSAPSQIIEGHEGKGTILNEAALEFEVMPSVTVKYAIVCDTDGVDPGAGNILYWCPLVDPKVCNAGDTFKIAVGALVLDLA